MDYPVNNLPPARPSRHTALPAWSNQDSQHIDYPTNNLPPAMPDRPRLKDYLAAMKPDTWGSSTGRSSKRSSARVDENMYIPPPVSNIDGNSSLYNNNPSHLTVGPTRTSLSNYSPRHYQVQSPVHSEQSPITYAPPSAQHSVPNQSYSMDPGLTLPAQSFHGHPQTTYNPPTNQSYTQQQQFYASQPVHQPNPAPQQPFHQPHPSQQPVYQQPSSQHSFPQSLQQPTYQPPQQQMHQPPQQQMHQPPQQQMHQPPQQQMYQPPQQPTHQPPQQQMYQPPQQQMHQQPTHQPPAPQQTFYQSHTSQQPLYQPPQQPLHQSPQQPINHQPSFQQPMYQTHQSLPQQPPHQAGLQQPSAYQNQNLGDSNRTVQQPLPPAKFDPYRPQPIGAYDIPKPQNPPYTPPQQQQQQQQQPTMPPPRINPQDVYRPGGLLSTNQPQAPSPSINNNNYDPNQYVQYVPPPPPPPAATPMTSSPINSVLKPSSVPQIADDLLSLALEQQIETIINSPEPNTPEPPQSASPVDEELQMKSNGKPIACIQPLSMVIEEKQQIQPTVTPVANFSPLQDPYDDKDKLDQLAADVQRFEKHVSTMTKKILNGTVPLEVEWKVSEDNYRLYQV
jgi:hypothetical protein